MNKVLKKVLSLSLCMAIPLGMILKEPMKAQALRNKVDTNADIARMIAEEGMVLLRNEGTLPFKQSDTIVGLGDAQESGMIYGGLGSGWVNATNMVSYAQGLKDAVKSGYIKSYTTIDSADSGERATKAMYFIARSTTENEDNSVSSYYLNSQEKTDILGLISVYGATNVVVVLNVGMVIDTTWLIENEVGAIVLSYYAGERAGEALANLLTGKSNFSGKTVDTWAKDYTDYPSSSIGTFAGDANTFYTEDIYVGYRYFETFDQNYERVNYEFGYGLSYTKFEFTEKSFTVDGDEITFNVTVRNKGTRAGKETVQVYYSAPQGEFGNPARELAGFAKTSLLAPGKKETVKITFKISDMAVYDDQSLIRNDSWVLLKGDYKFYVGNSVKDAALNGLIDSVYTVNENKVLETTCDLLPTQLNKRLLSDGTYQTLGDGGEGSLVKHVVKAYGANTIQAEQYSAKSQNPKTETFYVGADMSFGMGNLNNTFGEWLEYDLYVEEAGTYKMAFSMASAWANQNDMFTVMVNGEAQPIKVNMGQTTVDPNSTNEWYKCAFLTDDTYVIDLPRGDVKLRFKANGKLFQNIDYFMIYKDTVSSNYQTVIEAETSASSTLGTVQVSNGTATAPSNKAGNVYTYTLNVEESGVYNISLLASNVSFSSENSVKLSINGKAADKNFSLKRTAVGGENSLISNNYVFTKSGSVAVTLPKGLVTLTFTTLDASLTCIDKLYISPEKTGSETGDGYYDNTNEFTYIEDIRGKTLDEFISYNDVVADINKMDDFVSQMSVSELARLLAVEPDNNDAQTGTGGVGGKYISYKYGIPNANTSDGPAGIRYTNAAMYSTWMPCMTLLASTWNINLAQTYGAAVAAEAKLGNVQVWLAPGINIHRNPLCGRNFEYYSEDPLIAGMMGKYVTIGAQSLGISVCVKHFAVNNQETSRYSYNACVSNRALREIYFKPFEIIVKEADPYAVMSSYNRVNGEYVGATYQIITDMLYNEWGFEGAVFGDWTSTISHIKYVQAGNTFKSFVPDYDMLVAAYRNGILTREQLEFCVKNMLRFLMRTDSFIKVQTNFDNQNAVTVNLEDSTSWTYAKNGYTTDMFRLYAESEGKYTFRLSGAADCKVLLDNQEVELSGGKFTVDLSLGQHDLKIYGESSAVEALKGITISPYSESTSYNPPATDTSSNSSESSSSGCNSGLAGDMGALSAALLPIGAAMFAKKRKDD